MLKLQAKCTIPKIISKPKVVMAIIFKSELKIINIANQSEHLHSNSSKFHSTTHTFTFIPTTTTMPYKKKPKIPQTIAGLLVLPLSLPSQKALPNPTATQTHYLYLRPDAPKTPNADTPRSLFLANVPIDANEVNLRSLFRELCGAIVERVEFEGDEERREDVLTLLGIGSGAASGRADSDNIEPGKAVGGGVLGKRKRRQDKEVAEIEEDLRLPTTWGQRLRKSGSGAVVVFVDAASMQRAFRECGRIVKDGGAVEWSGAEGLGEKREYSFMLVYIHWVKALTLGLGYLTHHTCTYPSRRVLQEKVNAYLSAFAALESERSKRLAKQRSVPDEDGFITVTRGGRAGPARLEDAQAAAERLQERNKKRTGGDFYRFQSREKSKKKENELKRKFDEDKKRVQEMRHRKGRIRPEA